MIKHLILVMFVLTALQASAREADSLHSPIKNADKFCVAVQSVTLAADGVTRQYENIGQGLKHDKKDNSTWYLLKKKWLAGQQYRLLFKQVPTTGRLYIFSVDGINTPKIYGVLNMDSMYKAMALTPGMLDTMSLKYTGQERLCLWYTKSELPAYENLIMGIELTHGNFTARTNLQLGSSLLLPAPYWYFTKKTIGFVALNSDAAMPGTAVLPVIIEFDIH